MYGHRAASCAAQLLHEFREEFAGEAKRRDLINCVRKNHLGGRPGFRFWNRIGAGIWQHYLGRKRNKAWNSRAQDREVERLQRAAERARRDTKRSKLRRKPRNEADAQVLKAAKLNHKIDWLAERETQKRAQAAALLNEAAHLEREIMHLRAAHEEVCRD
jgi:hypothetical protein